MFAHVHTAVHRSYRENLGRVSWLAGDVWEAVLQTVRDPLQLLSAAIADTLFCCDLRPSQMGGCTSRKLRRGILDAAAWSRDVLIVLAGHCAGAVQVRGAHSRRGRTLSPTDFATEEEFKAAVKEAVASEQFRAVHTYARLRSTDRGSSEKFLSSFFSKESRFSVNLLDEDTGEPLSTEGMLDALVVDMMAQASNEFSADASFLAQVDLSVADIRQHGGLSPDTVAAAGSVPEDAPYTESEFEAVLVKCLSSKKCLHGCFSLLKASNQEHRSVLLGLANLSRHVGLTSTIWSLRQFAHIRKSGGMVVRRIQCLRPVSLVTDMAHLVDGLWLQRNRAKMQAFAGPSQIGGVSGTQMLLLAILLLGQLRDYQGLPLYLAILDLRWAFDVARLDSMRLACFEAGVRGVDWLLLDDVFARDRQTVQLHGLLSPAFVLGCGIAQGRRFSVHVFNSLLSWLRDEIRRVCPHGVAAWLPPQVMKASSRIELAGSCCDLVSKPAPPAMLQPFLERLQSDFSTPAGRVEEIKCAIDALPSYADRCALLMHWELAILKPCSM